MIIQAEFGTCEYIRVPDFVSIKFQIYPMFIATFFFFFLQQLLTSERLEEKFGCQIPLRYSISKMSSNFILTFFMVQSLNIYNDCCEIFAQILFKIYFFEKWPIDPPDIFSHFEICGNF